MTPRWRPTARLILMDPGGRVLLFEGQEPGRRFWFTPGGGVRRGEALTAAAARELAEETGLARTEAQIGPVVATSSGLWCYEDKLVFGADSFFLVRTSDETIDLSGQEELERSVIASLRWWTAAELARTEDEVFPAGLAALVAALASDGLPAAPVRLPWRDTRATA